MTEYTLIITDSYDATTDYLISLIGTEHIIRLNADRINDYSFHWNKEGVMIKNTYRSVDSNSITKVYWRKPFQSYQSGLGDSIENYLQQEIRYILLDLYQYFHLVKKTILVKPDSLIPYRKLNSLLLAAQYFAVPEWSLFWGEIPDNFYKSTTASVIKSLSSSKVSHMSGIFTTQAQAEDLDLHYPWFMQDLIPASHDLTVVYIGGKTFAYTADRRRFDYIDVRKGIGDSRCVWEPSTLSQTTIDNIDQFMKRIGLSFGRLDFLVCEGETIFLEVNPNGQWAWLDIKGENGLLQEMVQQVSPLSNARTYV